MDFESLKRQRHWEPMETAPKDGTRFLAYDDTDRVFVLFWDDCWLEDDLDCPDNPPVAWQPLPIAGNYY